MNLVEVKREPNSTGKGMQTDGMHWEGEGNGGLVIKGNSCLGVGVTVTSPLPVLLRVSKVSMTLQTEWDGWE